MITDLKIANDALIEMGQGILMNLDDANDKSSQRVVLEYLLQPTIDLILSLHYWGCAMSRKKISPDEDAPETYYTSAYSLPSDYATPFAVTDSDGHARYRDGWKIEGQKILSIHAPIAFVYGRQIKRSEAGLLRPHVAAVISAYLVWKTCLQFGFSKAEQATKYAAYKDILRDAKAVDQRENPQLVWLSNSWTAGTDNQPGVYLI